MRLEQKVGAISMHKDDMAISVTNVNIRLKQKVGAIGMHKDDMAIKIVSILQDT